MKADWIGIREALDTVLNCVDALDSTRVPVSEALGRVLATDIAAPIDSPPWTSSAMDGFAVRSTDVRGASTERPATLVVSQDVPAGGFPEGPLAPGTAARVMTGAPVPEGADSVIRVEDTDGGRGSDRATVTVFGDRDVGGNIRRKGEEFARGSIVLRRDTVLDPGTLGVAAALGQGVLDVVRRPRVALLTSGDELVDIDGYDEVLAGRRIVSSNTYTLAAQLEAAGCEVRHLGIAADTRESLRKALEHAAGCDALVTSAGVSVGEHDHVRDALLALDTEVRFWRVRIRPGSPFAFGRVGGLGGIPWFGLPGNPVSSMVTFELFARPALLRMAGRARVFRRTLPAVMLDDAVVPRGLTHFLRVRLLEREDGPTEAALNGGQGSGMLTSMVRADGLLVVPEETPRQLRGGTFPVIVLEAGTYARSPGF